jgi:hypothetical protein
MPSLRHAYSRRSRKCEINALTNLFRRSIGIERESCETLSPYVYGHADLRDAGIAKALTLDEARRIASNISNLPTLLAKRG